MAKKKTIDDVVSMLEDLAAMTHNGFLEMGEKIEGVRQELKAEMKTDREQNRKEHADIRFKASETVSRTEHNELKIRVEKLETQSA